MQKSFAPHSSHWIGPDERPTPETNPSAPDAFPEDNPAVKSLAPPGHLH